MPLLCWNCRGLGNPATVTSLTDLVRHLSPSVIFLSKTKSSTGVVKRLQRRLGFANGVWVDPKGRAGGLALLWKDDMEINLRSMSNRCIDVSIRHSSGEHWRFTDIYGWSD